MAFIDELLRDIEEQDKSFGEVANRTIKHAGEVNNLLKFLIFAQQPGTTLKEIQASAKLLQEKGINLITGKIT